MDQERRGQWLRGVLDLCVLALLARRDSYGYELTEGLAGIGHIQGGTLYPVLLRLERADLVSAYWQPGGAGPARKYYRLTPEGARTLRDAAGDWQGFAAGVDTILREVTAR